MYVRARRQSLRERALRAESEKELLVAQARQLERDRIAMGDAGALELRLGDGEDGRAAG